MRNWHTFICLGRSSFCHIQSKGNQEPDSVHDFPIRSCLDMKDEQEGKHQAVSSLAQSAPCRGCVLWAGIFSCICRLILWKVNISWTAERGFLTKHCTSYRWETVNLHCKTFAFHIHMFRHCLRWHADGALMVGKATQALFTYCTMCDQSWNKRGAIEVTLLIPCTWDVNHWV